MAATNVGVWIPEETTSEAFSIIQNKSAIEALARRVPMGSDTITIPRSAGVDSGVVPKSSAYPENDNTDDEVILQSRKFGVIIRFAEEDLADSTGNLITVKQNEWANTYAVQIDNAVLGTVGAVSQPTRPFTSVYQSLNTTQTIQGVSYTGGSNIVRTAGAIDYDDFNNVLRAVEAGAYFGGEVVVIAHPYFKSALRGVKDTTGNPVFVQGLAGTPDTVFGYPVQYTPGAVVTTAAPTNGGGLPLAVPGGGAAAAAGNPLLVVASKNALALGVRSGPEYQTDQGMSFTTDEWGVKCRARRAFELLHPKAASILEVTNV